MPDELRFSRPGDEDQLRDLWRVVFGDTDEYIDGFFRKLYTPGMAAVYTAEGVIVSAAYVLKLGDYVRGGRWTPCRAIYAYGTRPEYRGRGYGGKALRLALDSDWAGVTAICPAEPSLFAYYEPFGFAPCFSANIQNCTDVGIPLSGSVTRTTVRGYAALREELLHAQTHIDFDLEVLEYQEELCRRSGGGLFYVVCEGVRCCAAAELEEGKAKISELIVPSGGRYNPAALVARALRAETFTYRSPARPGEETAPFAMLSPAPIREDGPAWLGFAFD